MYDYEFDRVLTWLHQYNAVDASVTSKEQIIRLDLSGHAIKELPQSIGVLTNLVALNLSNNKLTSLPDSFANLTKLSNLDLRRNALSAFEPWFYTLDIRSLNLASNMLEDVHGLFCMPNLRVLDLSNNRVKNIMACEASEIRSLNLSGNFIKEFDSSFFSLANLTRLSISANLLTSLCQDFEHFEYLEELDASQNAISTIDESFFTLDIEKLDLSANALQHLSLHAMDMLVELSLDENPLTSLTVQEDFAPELEIFSAMACELKNFVVLPSKKLKKLSLSSNEIATLPKSIGEYTELVELDLESNALENLPDSLANLTQLSTLYIGSNPLTQEAKNVIKVLHPEICDIHMKTGIEIVKATESDFETMANLLALLFAIESDFEINFEKQYAGIAALHKDDRSDLLVAKDGEKVVGMITMQRLISSAEGSFVGQIEDLVVDEAYRKMGIGSRLINKMRSLAMEHGYKRIQLAADIENKNALAFYNRRGFKKTHLNVYHYNV